MSLPQIALPGEQEAEDEHEAEEDHEAEEEGEGDEEEILIC